MLTAEAVTSLSGNLLDQLIDIAKRELPHLLRFQITDRVRHLDIRMPRHALALELEYRSILESLRYYHRRRYPAFLKFDRVVHTAQRARPSTTDGSNSHLNFFGHFINQSIGSWLGIVLLGPQDHFGNPVFLL